MAHSLKHEKFKAFLLSKKSKPINEINVLNLNICSFVSRDNIIELQLAVLRALELIEENNLQKTRCSKAVIPGYTRHDSCFMTDFFKKMALFTIDRETKDGLKLMTKKLEFVVKFLPKTTYKAIKDFNELSLFVK